MEAIKNEALNLELSKEARQMLRGATRNERVAKAVENYILYGYPAGDFVMDVMKNRLFECTMRNDGMTNLTSLVKWMSKYAPMACFGNETVVKAWINMHKLHREKSKETDEPT